MKTTITLFLLSLLLVTGTVSAHGRWVVPSHTIISGKEATSISLDFSISNDVFFADNAYGGIPIATLGKHNEDKKRAAAEDPRSAMFKKMMASVKVAVTTPSGEQKNHWPIVNVGRKSVSEVKLSENGSYRIGITQDPIYFVSFMTKAGERGRRFGQLSAMTLPENTQKIKETKLINRVETYVTRNEPSTTAIKPEGKGLELHFITHPNELFANEQAQFKLLFNGSPLPNTDIKITREDTRYRDDRALISTQSNKDGMLVIDWQHAGMHVLEVEHQIPGTQYQQIEKHALYLSLEVFQE